MGKAWQNPLLWAFRASTSILLLEQGIEMLGKEVGPATKPIQPPSDSCSSVIPKVLKSPWTHKIGLSVQIEDSLGNILQQNHNTAQLICVGSITSTLKKWNYTISFPSFPPPKIAWSTIFKIQNFFYFNYTHICRWIKISLQPMNFI